MLPEIPKTFEKAMSFPVQHSESQILFTPENENEENFNVDQIIPGMYHCGGDEHWTPHNIRSHGFTHIIRIDKHISYLHIPVAAVTTTTTTKTTTTTQCSSNTNLIEHKTQRTIRTPQNLTDANYMESISKIDLGNEFEILDLNFGEESYLITVLPNCYKAVKFLDKALQNGGAIIIIDHNNNKQKCLTIVTAYLMYKNHLTVPEAFLRLQKNFIKAELDGFFISQLYEYEPILQVQRAQAKGSSCSREMRSALLKRKKFNDDNYISIDYNFNVNYCNGNSNDVADILME